MGWRKLPLRPPISGLPTSVGIIFGILTTLFLVISPVVPRVLWIHLLKVGEGPVKSNAWTEPLIVLVKEAGMGQRPNLYVNSRQVAWEDLDRTLKEELGRRREWVVYVGGDDYVSWQNVVDVIAAALGRQAKVVLITGPEGRTPAHYSP